MTVDEAKELRQELEGVEATMLRIMELWASPGFPAAEEMEELSKELSCVEATMQSCIDKAAEMPAADEVN
jgi:hypothetical protein